MSKATDKQVGGSHYKDYKIQPYEFFVANNIPFHKADIIKRILRYDHPTGKGREDLDKIKHEIDLILELDEMFKVVEDKDEFYKNSDIEYDPDDIIAGGPDYFSIDYVLNLEGEKYKPSCDCYSGDYIIDPRDRHPYCAKCSSNLTKLPK